MNIFVLDTNETKCASYHCDKHVVKMILETAQILCSVRHRYGDNTAKYRVTHRNHPCVLWAGECICNYLWLCNLGVALSREYTHRYGKIHKSQSVIEESGHYDVCSKLVVNGMMAHQWKTPFALAMPDKYKCDDAVIAYRNYYIGEKSGIATWYYTDIPRWFLEGKKYEQADC